MAFSTGASLALGLGSSLFSGGLSGLAGGLANRRANKRMVDQWNRENEYNHPVQQMARLEEAGLNPNLVYGEGTQGATGQAGSIDRPYANQWDFDNPVRNITDFQDVRLKGAQTDNVKTLATVNLQQAALKSAQTANEILSGYGKRLDNDLKRGILQTSIDAKKEATRQLELQTIGIQIDNMVKSRTAADTIKRAFYQAAAAKENVDYIKSGTALRNMETELKREGLENAPFWARWIYRHLEDFKF